MQLHHRSTYSQLLFQAGAFPAAHERGGKSHSHKKNRVEKWKGVHLEKKNMLAYHTKDDCIQRTVGCTLRWHLPYITRAREDGNDTKYNLLQDTANTRTYTVLTLQHSSAPQLHHQKSTNCFITVNAHKGKRNCGLATINRSFSPRPQEVEISHLIAA